MSFKEHPDLLPLPVNRAAYSDRTAWIMSYMSKYAYILFEESEEKKNELINRLKEGGFELVEVFHNHHETQAYIAKRETDRIAVVAFRGTELKKCRDILTDLDFRFLKNSDGTKTHNGFKRAFDNLKEDIEGELTKLENQGFSIYLTGHSLGGALALVAAREFSSDKIAACYTFGSPRVGNSEFGDNIKPPIYRIVNANDMVPRLPFPFIIEMIHWISYFKNLNILKYLCSERGYYAHHGDQRYLIPCKENFKHLRVIKNPGIREARFRYLNLLNIKLGIRDHEYDRYCDKLERYAIKRHNAT